VVQDCSKEFKGVGEKYLENLSIKIYNLA
jgi:hypothetical protein